MNAAALLAIALVCQVPCFEAAPAPKPMPLVEQEVECISVAHLNDGAELAFFWSMVQNDWTCLDHRWVGTSMRVSSDGQGKWVLQWQDDSEYCYRVVKTKCFVESWERENPLADQNQRPWFRQLLNPGLRKPPQAKE